MARTLEQYQAEVAAALKAAGGGRPLVPPPTCAKEASVLLSLVLDEATRLNEMLSAALGDCASNVRPDLAVLSLEEKLAMGERNALALAALAYKLAPARTLSSLDAQMDEHGASPAVVDATEAVLARLRS